MDPVTMQPVTSPAATAPGTVQLRPVSAKPPLVGDDVRRPGWVWLSHVLPMTFLLLSGQYTYSIIGGDMTVQERWYSISQAVAIALFTLTAASIALRSHARRKLISGPQCTALLLMSLSTMAIAMTFVAFTIPSELPEWITSSDELLYRAFCLAMPGAFYALLLLVSFPARRGPAVEFFGVLALAILMLVLLWSLFSILPEIAHFDPPVWVIYVNVIMVLFGTGTLVTAAITRMTLIAYTSIRGLQPHWQQIFMFVIAIAGPLGGLWLNRNLPFPVDFQAPVIYTLALVNGGLLVMPVTRSVFWHRVIWLAQCVMFPFSAYFFIVFLPWMPASPLAMIVCGAGFLMLAPIVLGLAHGYRIVDGYREEIRDGSRWKIAIAGLVAVSVLPVALVASMWQDRQSLNEAIDYIYSPDYRKDITYKGDLWRLQDSLQHLRNMKHGIFLPFITPLYNGIVFHNLVLPDGKIEELQNSFFGSTAQQQVSPLLASTSRWSNESFPLMPSDAPPTDAVLSDVQITSEPEQGVTISHLTLSMHNPSSQQSEFVMPIHISEGDYVSNFGLYIGDKLVPGRIAEKKTAMWVYEKISRVERRDPSLLIYKDRTDLELRVFPLAASETRRVEFDVVPSQRCIKLHRDWNEDG